MPVETSTEQPDIKALIANRNQSEQAAKEGKPVEAPKPAEPASPKAPETKPAEPKAAAADEEEENRPSLPRHARREMNRLREENGRLQGRLEMLEQLVRGAQPKGDEKPPADLKPQRNQFQSDADFHEALGAWAGRQEAGKTVAKDREQQQAEERQEQQREHFARMREKALDDQKHFPDWETAREGAEDLEWTVEEHPVLTGLILSSDVQAAILYHFAKHQDELQKLLDLKDDNDTLITRFRRLEGRVEKLYEPSEPEKGGKDGKTAAEAAKETSKARTPEKAEQARDSSTAARDAQLPRPSSETAARGGTAAPEEPTPGSAAWMAKRNAQRATSRY